MRESDLLRALKKLGRRGFDGELQAWVHSTAELPLDKLLLAQGVKPNRDKSPLAQQLGLRVSEAAGTVTLKTVLRGGAAESAGMAAGDEWLGIEFAAPRRGTPVEAWRIHRLDDVEALRGGRPRLTALVARDRQLLRLTLDWPADQQSLRLVVGDAQRVGAWLGGAAPAQAEGKRATSS